MSPSRVSTTERRSRPIEPRSDAPARASLRRLAAELTYEIVPRASLERALDELPPNASVSITCLPSKGIAATQDLAVRLLDRGHRPIPHIAARLVEDRAHATKLAVWLREYAIEEVFVVAGDAPTAAGPYEGALALLRDLLSAQPGIARVGITGYPDGHAFVGRDVLAEQLLAKRDLLAAAGVGGWISTQMCFDAPAIRRWLAGIRVAGVELPVHVGVPGIVDRARLLTMGTRIGVGSSMRYLRAHRSAVRRLIAPGGYDPTDLVDDLADDAVALGVEAVHSFTFNAVAATRAWRDAIVG